MAVGLPTPRYLHFPVAARNGEKLSKQTLAPAIDAAGGATVLLAALDFLGQVAPEPGTPAFILEQAARRWDPARIPRGHAREVTDGSVPAYPHGV